MAAGTERTPPHDLYAEEATLGALLIDPEAIYKVLNFLKPEDFFREKNRWIYECCLELLERGEIIDHVTVASELARRGKLEAVGGTEYLSYLTYQIPSSYQVEHYARIVHRLAMMRKLIAAANKIASLGYDTELDFEEALSKAESYLSELRSGELVRDFYHIHDVLDLYFEESGIPKQPHDGYLPYIPTGFVDLDRLLGGLQRSDMIILAARPSMGKTSLALNIARNAAMDYGAKVAIFSLEMSKMELAYRFLACESGVNVQSLRLNLLTDEERDKVMEAIGVLSGADIYINDSPFLRVSDIRVKAKRLKQDHDLDLVIIDYLQLVHPTKPRDSRVQEISEISFSIKEMARELNVPVLVVSQLSRAVETRATHIPQLSDLRESGSIEQDADVVIFIYRDDVYYTREEWERRNPDKPYPQGVAKIIVAKHRNGPRGEIELLFDEKIAKFRDAPVEPQGAGGDESA